MSIFVVLTATIRGVRTGSLAIELTTSLMIGLAAISGLLGESLGLALSVKDTIDRRISDGEPVNGLLQLYFGRGKLSLFVWFISIIIITFIVAVLGSMMKLI